jgi:hypothetical protein
MKTGVTWLLNVWGRLAKPVSGDYRALFGGKDPRGNRILADLRQYCHDAVTSFVPGDPHQTSFNEGSRDVLSHIREMAGLSERDFPQETEIHRED